MLLEKGVQFLDGDGNLHTVIGQRENVARGVQILTRCMYADGESRRRAWDKSALDYIKSRLIPHPSAGTAASDVEGESRPAEHDG
jgi:hypothetical protein